MIHRQGELWIPESGIAKGTEAEVDLADQAYAAIMARMDLAERVKDLLSDAEALRARLESLQAELRYLENRQSLPGLTWERLNEEGAPTGPSR